MLSSIIKIGEHTVDLRKGGLYWSYKIDVGDDDGVEMWVSVAGSSPDLDSDKEAVVFLCYDPNDDKTHRIEFDTMADVSDCDVAGEDEFCEYTFFEVAKEHFLRAIKPTVSYNSQEYPQGTLEQ